MKPMKTAHSYRSIQETPATGTAVVGLQTFGVRRRERWQRCGAQLRAPAD